MRQRTYLNVILTVNAVLLAGLVWTQIADTPLLAETASAQNRSSLGPAVPNVPNAGKQREQIAKEIVALRTALEKTRTLLESGRVKVEVTNLGEIKTDGS